jgi:hypothetical protein
MGPDPKNEALKGNMLSKWGSKKCCTLLYLPGCKEGQKEIWCRLTLTGMEAAKGC